MANINTIKISSLAIEINVNNISIDSGTPCYFFAMEFQGDLLTVGAIP